MLSVETLRGERVFKTEASNINARKLVKFKLYSREGRGRRNNIAQDREQWYKEI